MLSLPNAGSSWLAELIAAHTRWSRYCMEYFNPLRNSRHYGQLALHFGCELIDCYRHIATRGEASIHTAIERTWWSDDYNFTKEVFSPLKLEAFAQHFHCFVLTRELTDTFPPKRARVWSFYEHAWHALASAGVELIGHHFEDRAIVAHTYLQGEMQRDAARLGVPVIRYRELFDDAGLEARVQAAIGECDRHLLDAIRASRVLSER